MTPKKTIWLRIRKIPLPIRSIFNAYDLAFKTDPTSAFGGIIAFNKIIDHKTAQEINLRQFVEVVIAPGYEDEAVKEFSSKKIGELSIEMAGKVNDKTLKDFKGTVLFTSHDHEFDLTWP